MQKLPVVFSDVLLQHHLMQYAQLLINQLYVRLESVVNLVKLRWPRLIDEDFDAFLYLEAALLIHQTTQHGHLLEESAITVHLKHTAFKHENDHHTP